MPFQQAPSAQDIYDAMVAQSTVIMRAGTFGDRLAAKVASDALYATAPGDSPTEPKVDAVTANAWSPEAVTRVTAVR